MAQSPWSPLDLVQDSQRSIGYTINLAGYCMDIFLFGILTIQAYLYYIAFPRDARLQKSVVLSIYLVGTAQTALALHDFYTRFCLEIFVIDRSDSVITHVSFFPDISIGRHVWFTVYLSGGLVALIVQLVYASRIWKLAKSKVVTILVTMLAFGQFVASVLAAADLQESIFPTVGSQVLITWGPLGIICDALIAGYMTYFLSKQLRESVYMPRRTSNIVNRIRRLVLETGLLTVLVSIGYTVALMTTSFGSFMLPGLILGKIYSNSLLVMLNNRFTIIGGRHFEDDTCISLYNEPSPDVIPSASTAGAVQANQSN